MTRLAVLLVDDEQLILDSLRIQIRKALGEARCAIECATDVEEAWDVIEELVASEVRIVLIFSDWLMPGTRGDAFLGEVKNRYPKITRVLLTGQADSDVLRRVQDEGIVDKLLFKPWTQGDLLHTISLALPG
ncbi:MAG: response regulator [Deltaproteobacteria bacterium]|nr:response regulator [Deltaproteobacteria bacterium]